MAYEASSVTLSKKLSNGHHSSFAGTSVYDGVFASPLKKLGAAAANISSCAAEDYREIFRGGSEASSIPFLDVPELSEQGASVDVRSSKLDYSKIFGGGGGDSTFAARFEELSFEPNTRKKSEKEWTSADRMSPSKASENSSISDGNDVWSPEASHRANSGVKKFNMSYNKINNRNVNGTSETNGMTHIAQLHAARGYAHLVDEATPPCRTEGDQPVVSLVNDGCQKTSTYQGATESHNFVRAAEDIPLDKTVKQTSGADVDFQSSPNWFKSNSMGKPYEKYEAGSGNPRSEVPSSTSLPHNFDFGFSDGRNDPNGGSTSSSPPFFEEEIDTNSVAATSVAALRKAIEEAQARIKVAKEIMERKKAGLKYGSKSFGDKLEPEERKDGNVAYGVSRSRKKKTHGLREEVDIPFHATSGVIQHNTTGPSFVAANFEVRERVPSSENGETSWNEISSKADHRCEEAEVPEAEQFYDVEDTGENWSPTIEVDVPKVSAMTSKQNVTGEGQVPESFKVQKFVSGAKDTARENVCNSVKSSQADHRQEKSEPAEVAEQFYEFEEVTRVQENVQKENIILIGEEVFEKPQEARERLKLAIKEDNPEELEEKIEIRNGINRSSEYSKDGGEARVEVEVFDKEKNEQKQRFYPNCKENDETIQLFDKNDKCDSSPIEFLEPLNDGKLLETGRLDDTKHTMRELTTGECVESERKGEEENEKEQSHAHGLEDNEKWSVNKAIKGERTKERLNGFHLGKNIAKILSHDVEREVIEKTHERDVSRKKENENREEESGQWVDIGRISTKSDPSEGDEDKTKAAVEEPRNQGSNLGAVDNDEIENQKPALFTDGDKTLIVSEEVPLCKDSRSSVTELSKCLMENNDSVEEKCDVEKTDVLRTDGSHQGLQLIKRVKPMEHETETIGENDTSDEGRIRTNFVRKRWDKLACQFEILHNLREHIKKMSPEFENVEYIKKSEAAVNQEDDEDEIECFGEQGRFTIGITMKEAQSSDSSEGEVESVGLDEETESSTSKEKDHENCEEISISEVNEESQKETLPIQSEDRNEVNDRAAVNVEESTAKVSLKKEAEQERKQQRRIDEAKEREREIEKGRIAVERAVREARERAFAEARERAAAEKAGTRQRVKAEARERVGKTYGEPNTKSVADRARETKLKAERAAVERATAEARERALEKAMSSKTASQAKKQNPQHKGPSSTSTSRYPYSSNGGVSNSTERSDGGNGESTQRCKARSERHQRISERAEKALAEKNRRDLLAQKEQAERNRLAETLDIEVKRWSSGKEGNLRALLSTLQYILGPDSGWQPIPLTDIITTAAVKKAYRKATLIVHPDKLQQRGANIQQKYTCEKVFDLLKEAWNKFNVEER